MTTTLFDRIVNRPPRTAELTFPLDPSDADEYHRLKKAVTTAEASVDLATGDAVKDAKKRHKIAVKALDDFEAATELVTFHMEAIGLSAVEALQNEHPATAKQRKASRDAAGGNPAAEETVNMDTFPPALIAACTVKVTSTTGDVYEDVTAEDIDRLTNATGWGEADVTSLLATATAVNRAPSLIVDAGKGSGRTLSLP